MFTGDSLPPSSTGTAHNGAIELAWERFRTGGEPLLLVNGLSSPRVAYEDGFVLEMAQAGFEPTRFDNRDAGHSTHTSGGYRLADMAADAIAVIDSLGWETAHVFGISMGGMIVQQLGIDFSDRLRTITSLMSTTGEPGFGRPTPQALEALLTPMPLDCERWLDLRVQTEAIWGSPGISTAEVARAKGESLYRYGVHPGGAKHQYQAIVESGSRDSELTAVQVPTLVLHGSADTLVQPDGGRHTAAVMANARFELLDGMGHDLPREYWPVIAHAVAGLAADAGFGQD